MVPTMMDLGGLYIKRNEQQRKKIADVLGGEIEKKTEEVIYNIDTLRCKHKPRIPKVRGIKGKESGKN